MNKESTPINSNTMYIEMTNKVEKTITKDDITVAVTVGKVKNGYVISKHTSGRRKPLDGKAETDDGLEWFEETETYISTENPLKDEKEEQENIPDVNSLFKSMADMSGKLSI